MTQLTTTLVLSLALLAAPAFAEVANPPGQGQVQNQTAPMTGHDMQAMDTTLTKGACSSDVQQYCSDIAPGKGRVAACLHSHSDKISGDCQSQMKTAMTEFKTMRKACRADVAKYCKGTAAGGGQIMSCLKQHEDELTSACRSDTLNFVTTG